MRTAWVVGGAFVLALAQPAFAEELSALEKTWAKVCVDGLAAPTQRQRDSAAAALGRLGVDAMPVVFANIARLKTDDHWKALEAACLAMGTQEVVAWLEATKDWPKACADRLQALLSKLQSVKPTAPTVGPPLPKSPPDVAAEVTRILESFRKDDTFFSSDPRIDELEKLGRPAMGALFEAARGKSLGSLARMAVLQALERLVTVDDLRVIAGMLANGDLDVGAALKRLPAEQAIPVLLEPVARGRLSFEVLEGLKPFERDPRVVKALITWLDGRVTEERSSLGGNLAEALARVGATDAIPVLVRAMDNPNHAFNRRRIASAVIDLGDRRGIAALLDFFRAPPRDRFPDSYERHAAGEDLNRVVGRTVYKGSYRPRDNSPWSTAEGNFEEATKEFDAWWAASKDKLRYDAERRAWLVDK